MNEPLHRQETIFAQACALPVEERTAYLAHACANDRALRRTLGELLEASSDAGDFLGAPPAALAPELTFRPPPREHSGERIGRYRLIEKIGEGGAGVI